MNTNKKIQALQKLLDKASELSREDSSDPDFKVWKNLVERTFIKVFGEESFETTEFRKLKFVYSPMISFLGEVQKLKNQPGYCLQFDLLSYCYFLFILGA